VLGDMAAATGRDGTRTVPACRGRVAGVGLDDR